MSVSNVIYETTSFFPAIPALSPLREPHQENHFDGQNLFAQDSKMAQQRARTFFKHLEMNLNAPKGNKSSIQALLERFLHLPTTEENKSLFSEITQAFFKQKGYFSRLFSNVSWKEWFENRTALGKVASQFRNCIESRAEVCSFTKEMTPQLSQKANEETSILLKRLASREETRTSKSSCLYGLTSGIAASFLLKNPLPLLLKLSECFPRAFAQQKVGNEFQVHTYTSDNQEVTSVASFSNDNFVVTWSSNGQDGSDYGVYGQLFNGNGSNIGNEFQVNTYIDSYQRNPSVASLADGNFVVTWESGGQDGSFAGVYGQIFNGNGTKIGIEFRANSYTTSHQAFPSVANISNGNFVVTWMSLNQDSSSAGVYGQLFNGNGSKIRSEFRANFYTPNNQWSPSIASLADGNFVVTWISENQDGSLYGVYGQLFNGNGTKIGNEFQVNTYTANHQLNPSVASLADGNFVVTWESDGQDGSLFGVYGQLFDGNGSKIGNEFRVNNYVTLDQKQSSVASFTNGNFVVTWESDGQDGSNYGVYGQLYDGNGTKIGNEFRVNNYVTLDQKQSSVASFTNGNFVVTWESDGQDGSNYGIYGQIFHDNITYPSSSTTSTTTTTSSTTPSTSNSTTSTTTTTSSTSLSVSSNTMSAIGPTSTSVNPSSSRTTVPSTTRPITASNSRSTLSATSDPNNRFSWGWFLLGGVGAISCLGLTGYFIIRSRVRKKDGDVLGSELETMGQPDRVTAEGDYLRTPDRVTAEGDYLRTPDRVTQENHSNGC